jgi:hypothetical protein
VKGVAHNYVTQFQKLAISAENSSYSESLGESFFSRVPDIISNGLYSSTVPLTDKFSMPDLNLKVACMTKLPIQLGTDL